MREHDHGESGGSRRQLGIASGAAGCEEWRLGRADPLGFLGGARIGWIPDLRDESVSFRPSPIVVAGGYEASLRRADLEERFLAFSSLRGRLNATKQDG